MEGLSEEGEDMNIEIDVCFLKTWEFSGNTVCHVQIYALWFSPHVDQLAVLYFLATDQIPKLWLFYRHVLLFIKLRWWECGLMIKRPSLLLEDPTYGQGPVRSISFPRKFKAKEGGWGRVELWAPWGICSPSILHQLVERRELGKRWWEGVCWNSSHGHEPRGHFQFSFLFQIQDLVLGSGEKDILRTQ